MRTAADYAAMSDADRNPMFRRRWRDPPERQSPAPCGQHSDRANVETMVSFSSTTAARRKPVLACNSPAIVVWRSNDIDTPERRWATKAGP